MRILYIDLDTVRPDHLGCYGYSRNTSPNIDHVASEGTRFDNCYVSDAPCLPSRMALATGQFGIRNGVVGHGRTAADLRAEGSRRLTQDRLAGETLAASLRSGPLLGAEFKTALISGFATRHSSWPFYAGYHEIYDTGKAGYESAGDVTPIALDWLERNADKENWFLHINYWDAHTPYRAPEEFGNPFENEPFPNWIDDERLAAHWQACGPHTPQDLMMWHGEANPEYPRHPGQVRDQADLKKLIDGYDCGIAFADSHIGLVLQDLRDRGLYEETAIIISSDHGENFGELEIYAEHATADEATCRIPMIIKWPGGRSAAVDSGLHYHLDLAPTLAELLGNPPKPSWDGSSYAGSVLNGEDCGRDYLVLSQCAHVCQRSVRWGPWLYIRTYHDGFHLFPKEMLFNIEADPRETEDLAERLPDRCRQGAAFLLDWLDRNQAILAEEGGRDPLWDVMEEGGPMHAQSTMLERYCERLEQTGRGRHATALRRRQSAQSSARGQQAQATRDIALR